MKSILIITITLFIALNCNAQSPIGKWKCIATYSSFDNKKTNMEAALHQSLPCTKNTIEDFQANGKIVKTYSGCDAKYVETQNKLFKDQKWKVEGNKITIYSIDISLGNTYTISFSGNKMTWTNADETITYQKL